MRSIGEGKGYEIVEVTGDIEDYSGFEVDRLLAISLIFLGVILLVRR